MKKRILSVILCMAIMFTSVPIPASAAEYDQFRDEYFDEDSTNEFVDEDNSIDEGKDEETFIDDEKDEDTSVDEVKKEDTSIDEESNEDILIDDEDEKEDEYIDDNTKSDDDISETKDINYYTEAGEKIAVLHEDGQLFVVEGTLVVKLQTIQMLKLM